MHGLAVVTQHQQAQKNASENLVVRIKQLSAVCLQSLLSLKRPTMASPRNNYVFLLLATQPKFKMTSNKCLMVTLTQTKKSIKIKEFREIDNDNKV